MRTTGLELTRHYSSNKQDLLQGCPTWDITAPRLVLLVNCGLWDTGKPSILTFSNLSKRKLADPSEGTLHLLLKTGSYLQPFKLYWKNFGWTFFILITSLISRWATISPPPPHPTNTLPSLSFGSGHLSSQVFSSQKQGQLGLKSTARPRPPRHGPRTDF